MNSSPLVRMLRTDRVFVAVVVIGLFAMAARNMTDPDVWWHLKTGEYIAQHHTVPHADPFSYTRNGKPWIAHEWLSELLIYEIFRAAGYAGLIVAFAAMIAVAFFVLYLRCGPNPYVAGIFVLLGGWATQMVWGVRPQVISLLLTSIWLLILERSETRPKLLWWTLPVMLLWANLHAGFAVGLALSAVFLASDWINSSRRRSVGSRTSARFAAIIFALDLAIVAINPNGLRLYTYPFITLHSSAMQTFIAEWHSPNFHNPEYWLMLVLLIALMAGFARSRSKFRARDLFLLFASFYASLCYIRMIPLFVLVAVPLIVRSIEWPKEIPSQLRTKSLANACILLAVAAFALAHTMFIIHQQPEAEKAHFPAGASAYLQLHPPPGHIFNNYDWGGYLIWKLSPETPVFIDGRADLYGEGFLNDYAAIDGLKGGWREKFDIWKISAAVLPQKAPLIQGLLIGNGWKVVYKDAQSVVLESRTITAGALRLP